MAEQDPRKTASELNRGRKAATIPAEVRAGPDADPGGYQGDFEVMASPTGGETPERAIDSWRRVSEDAARTAFARHNSINPQVPSDVTRRARQGLPEDWSAPPGELNAPFTYQLDGMEQQRWYDEFVQKHGRRPDEAEMRAWEEYAREKGFIRPSTENRDQWSAPPEYSPQEMGRQAYLGFRAFATDPELDLATRQAAASAMGKHRYMPGDWPHRNSDSSGWEMTTSEELPKKLPPKR